LSLLVSKYIKRHTPKEEIEDNIVPDTTMFNQLGIKVQRD